MAAFVPVTKVAEHELPVPTVWREALGEVVESFAKGDFALTSRPASVQPIDPDLPDYIARQLQAYGAKLVPLPDESWASSVCMWQAGYWGVLIDLFTEAEGLSDLVMSARIFEDDAGYRIEISSVYVP